MLELVCKILNKNYARTVDRWYEVKRDHNGLDRLYWSNDVCGGYLDDMEMFDLLGQLPPVDPYAKKPVDTFSRMR